MSELRTCQQNNVECGYAKLEAERDVLAVGADGNEAFPVFRSKPELPACMAVIEIAPDDDLVNKAFETTRYNEGVGSGKDLIREYIKLAGVKS